MEKDLAKVHKTVKKSAYCAQIINDVTELLPREKQRRQE